MDSLDIVYLVDENESVAYLNVSKETDDQLVFVDTSTPLENIFLVLRDKSYPIILIDVC